MLTLTYFDGAGRGFPARVALFKAFGKDGWADERVDYATFLKGKEAGSYPLGSLPVLTLASGKKIAQSTAIARWAAKAAGMYPADADAAAVDDFIVETFNEILSKTPSSPDEAEKKAKREEYSQIGFMHTAMDTMEAAYAKYTGGCDLSVADLSLFAFVKMIVTDDFTYVPASYMDGYPNLATAYESVKAHPIVVEYHKNYSS